ncbi:hypothetical protein GGQ88_003552 [Novosphingobium hassiacum]|uniref:Uncharacterized protein n=1 Tax=Novosphingobium hassiacum TaxID=173676 RepID=A0A7W5ZZW5_9SPHN|nr:hypothetical protein [Novosphingobium hassiacum]MBB3862254.1 hypothetical protein [Novosphingobium hassiacum]
MSYEATRAEWWTSFSIESVDPDALDGLAQWCEQLHPAQQREAFARVVPQLSSDSQGIDLLVEVGAFESAAIALIPRSAIFTGGRLKDGSFVAQVVPEGSAGAHSRDARSLAMAWLAALLRAVARHAAEAKRAA